MPVTLIRGLQELHRCEIKSILNLDKTHTGDACSKLRSIQVCMMRWDPRTRCCFQQWLCLSINKRITLFTLEVINACAQINHGWIDTTEQEVVYTIDQPSVYSNLEEKVETHVKFIIYMQGCHYVINLSTIKSS